MINGIHMKISIMNYTLVPNTPLIWIREIPFTSRRDPTKVIKVGDQYHVCIRGGHLHDPVGLKNATDTVPATDWDLADIWHATSTNGIDWVESKSPAVERPPKPEYGSRSICTPGFDLEG